MSDAIVSDWYQYRATEIERLSRQADSALEFVKLGIERGAQVGTGAVLKTHHSNSDLGLR